MCSSIRLAFIPSATTSRFSRACRAAWLLLAAGAGGGCASGKGAGPSGTTGDAHLVGDAGPGSGDGGGAGIGFGEGGATGGACSLNADCADSAAAQAFQNVRCIGRETYCLEGECHADCADSCTAIRSDVNPCPAPRLCAPGLGICKIVPILCQSATDCPQYLPPTADGGTAAWSCEAGICAYPDFQLATR
jgi:hypothetical protein